MACPIRIGDPDKKDSEECERIVMAWRVGNKSTRLLGFSFG